MISRRSSKKIESLFTIIKVRKGSVHATHMPDCAMEHEIVVIASHCPLLVRRVTVRLGLGGRRGAEVLVVLVWPTVNMQNMLNMQYM